jgi:hypothetical protein
MDPYATGYSAPPSELDVSIVNVSSSSGSTAIAPGPSKRSRPTTETGTAAILPQGGSPVPNVVPSPAMVATTIVDQLPTYHNLTSSGSSISVTSSASRQRRVNVARARRELAEARLEEIEADNEFASGSQAGSVGRRMDDVQSEVGSTKQEDEPNPSLPTEIARQQLQPAAGETSLFGGVFTPARGDAPSIYDIFSTARGVHVIDEMLAHDGPRVVLPSTIEHPSDVEALILPQGGLRPTTVDVDPYRVELLPQGGAAQYPTTFGDEWFASASLPQGGAPSTLNHS